MGAAVGDAQALPVELRSQWSHLAEVLELPEGFVADMHSEESEEPANVEDFRRRASQRADTKCAVCRSTLFPEEVALLPLGDFTAFKSRLTGRKGGGAQLAPLWDLPVVYPLGYLVHTRGCITGRGPALGVCSYCARHPQRKHFYSQVMPTDLVGNQGTFAPPNEADLGPMNPVRCHDRHCIRFCFLFGFFVVYAHC